MRLRMAPGYWVGLLRPQGGSLSRPERHQGGARGGPPGDARRRARCALVLDRPRGSVGNGGHAAVTAALTAENAP